MFLALERSPWLHRLRGLAGQRFVRDAGMLAAAGLVAAPLQLLQGVLVARWLEPRLYGIAALVMSYPETVYSFCEVKASDALIKYLNEFDVAGDNYRALGACYLGFCVDFGVAALAFAVVAFTAVWAARSVVHRADLSGIIVAYAAACVTRGSVGTSYAILATAGRFDLAATIDAWVTVVRVILVLGSVWLGYQAVGVVMGSALGIVFAGVLYGCAGWIQMQQRWGSGSLRRGWHALAGRRAGMIRFLAYNDANNLIGAVCDQLDVLALGYFRGPVEAGFYKLAKTVAGSTRYISSPLQAVLYADLARLWVLPDQAAYWKRVRQFALRVGVPLGCALLVAIPLAFRLMVHFVGEAYRPVTLALYGTIAGSSVWVFGFWLRPLYFTTGALRSWTGIKLVPVLALLPLLPLFASRWGYIGTSWWYCALNLFTAIGIFLWTRRLGFRNSTS